MTVGVWPKTLISRRPQQRTLVGGGNNDGSVVSSTMRPPGARTRSTSRKLRR
jgi:hypothetical protein